jgi:hypothetical protein
MSAIDEGIVREYFEQNGFLVRQVRKYAVQARRKTSEEEVDLLVFNPAWRPGARSPEFMLFAHELPYLRRAVVAIKPWHTSSFTPASLKGMPELFGFLADEVRVEVAKLFPSETDQTPGEAAIPRILVLPGLPTQEPTRSESVRLLRERGVDGIISFRAMLLDLIDKVEVNRSYGKSDTLQVIRLLKNYDLLRDPQMDLLPRAKG